MGKERDVGTLAARPFQHSRQRQDAISRDSVDDVRRADRDKEETLRSQRLARAALAATKEQQSEAAGHLANSLIALNHFSSGALSDRLFASVAHALYLAKTVDHRELEAAAAAVVSSLPRLHDGNSNADLTDT